jgi:hypothetical protein
MAMDHAWRQYAKVLVAGARIEGFDLDADADGDRLMAAGHP